jgi:radical SAM protein with 4Fe4S-binding SPASM domain
MNIPLALTNTKNGLKNILLPGELIKPSEVIFELTDQCNSHCLHCNKWKQLPIGLLSLEEINLTFSDSLFSDIKEIILTGGETTLRPDLEQVILAIHELKPKTRIILSTNALLPDIVIRIVKTMIENKICFSIGTSLDGIGIKHDRLRGTPGNFKKVISLLQELKHLQEQSCYPFDIAVGYVLSQYTDNNYYETRTFLQDIGLDLFVQWYDTNQYYGNKKDNIDIEKHIQIVQTLPESLRKRMWIKYLQTGKICFSCYAMKTFFLLRSNGDVTPCLTKSEISAGNVKNKTPTEIWNSSEMKEIRSQVKKCKGCLNSWSVDLSLHSYYLPIIIFELEQKLKKFLTI